jgi:hypothetical protein
MDRPLPKFRVTIQRMDEATRQFIQDGYPENLGLRTKFGGSPDWEQDGHDVRCPECGKPMPFVGQIDSFQHDSKHNPNRADCLSDKQKFIFGDVGMVYLFFCFECLQVQTVFECG